MKTKQGDRKVKLKYILIASLGLALAILSGCTSSQAEWDSKLMKNEILELHIVPQIGGRIIQYKLNDYGFFWVNPQLVNTTPPPSGLGPDEVWLNYGGDKLWPAPQGWDNDQQWPGPPDAVLDGQPYVYEVLNDSDSKMAVKLTSGKDKRSGIQFSRVIRIYDDSTKVSIDATMTNIDDKPRRWGIWAHTQLDAGNKNGDGFNQNYWAYCPINPDSVFPRGYDVLYGLVNNMSYKPDYENNMMKIHYTRRVGKIGMDSDAGWLATVNAADGYVFVHRFTYQPDKPYPENSSVEFWFNGLGEFVAWGKINEMPEDPKENAYVFESEVISPYAKLLPGQKYDYHYDWYTARIAPDSEVIDCSDVAAVCKPLTASLQNNCITINGSFGVFYKGYVSASVLNEQGNRIQCEFDPIQISPVTALDLNETVLTCQNPNALNNAKTLILTVFTSNHQPVGQLASAAIYQP